MKRLFVIVFLAAVALSFCILPFFATAQPVKTYQGQPLQIAQQRGYVGADSGLSVLLFNQLGTGQFTGHLRFLTNGSGYVWNGSQWLPIGSGGGGGSYLAGYAIVIENGLIRVDTLLAATRAWVNGRIAAIPAPTWGSITDKPTVFNPAPHTHSAADITSGILPISRGGTGTATPGLVAGSNVSISGTWPNQTINAAGGSGGDTTGKGLLTRDAAAATYTRNDSTDAKVARLNTRIDNLPAGGLSDSSVTLPRRVVYLSRMNVPSGADLSEGSGTFGADGRAAIQSVLNLAQQGPLTVYWDVKTSLSGRLLVYSNTEIIGSPGCGAILRSFANDFMLVNAHIDTVQTITSRDSNITIRDLILNGNSRNYVLNDYAQNLTNSTAGFMTGCVFVGVKNIRLENMDMLWHRGYGMFICNYRNVRIDGGRMRCDPTQARGQDGYHFGPGDNLYMGNLSIKSGDAGIALNADDVNYAFSGVPYPSPGYPITYGDITNTVIEDIRLDSAQAGVVGLGGQARHVNLSIKRISGICYGSAVYLDNLTYSETSLVHAGPGHFINVDISDITAEVFDYGHIFEHTDQNLFFSANFDGLRIRNVSRRLFTLNQPTLRFRGGNGKVFRDVEIDGLKAYNASNTQVRAHVYMMNGVISPRFYIHDCEAISNNTHDTLISVDSARIERLSTANNYGRGLRTMVHTSPRAQVPNINGNGVTLEGFPDGISHILNSSVDDIVLSNLTAYTVLGGQGVVNRYRGDAFLDTMPVYVPPTPLLAGYSDIDYSQSVNMVQNSPNVWTSTGTRSYGVSSSYLPANTDGSIAFQIPPSTATGRFVQFGWDVNSTLQSASYVPYNWTHGFTVQLYGEVYAFAGGVSAGQRGVALAGDWMRLKRTAGTVTLERSTDNGVTWAISYTFPGTSTAALYPGADLDPSATLLYPQGSGLQ